MVEPTTLYLIRHGQTDLNRDRRFRGMTRAPLNAEGRLEALRAARLLDGSGVEVVFASPVTRAFQTAEIIADQIGAGVSVDEGFTDVDYGLWQGLTLNEVAEEFGAGELELWKRDPGAYNFPGGDSMPDVMVRVRTAMLRVAGDNPGKCVAAVSHLAVLKVCFLAALELGFEWFWKVDIASGGVSRFSYSEGEGFTLEWWGCVPPGGG